MLFQIPIELIISHLNIFLANLDLIFNANLIAFTIKLWLVGPWLVIVDTITNTGLSLSEMFNSIYFLAYMFYWVLQPVYLLFYNLNVFFDKLSVTC